jgi:hypothetical protein
MNRKNKVKPSKNLELLDKFTSIFLQLSKHDLESTLTCSICLNIVSDPVLTKCSHSFCKECLTRWLYSRSQCPMCRKPIFCQDTISNLPLQNLIKFLNNTNIITSHKHNQIQTFSFNPFDRQTKSFNIGKDSNPTNLPSSKAGKMSKNRKNKHAGKTYTRRDNHIIEFSSDAPPKSILHDQLFHDNDIKLFNQAQLSQSIQHSIPQCNKENSDKNTNKSLPNPFENASIGQSIFQKPFQCGDANENPFLPHTWSQKPLFENNSNAGGELFQSDLIFSPFKIQTAKKTESPPQIPQEVRTPLKNKCNSEEEKTSSQKKYLPQLEALNFSMQKPAKISEEEKKFEKAENVLFPGNENLLKEQISEKIEPIRLFSPGVELEAHIEETSNTDDLFRIERAPVISKRRAKNRYKAPVHN